MGDLISRQAAIDVLSKACQEWRGIFGRCEDGLLALPSAQPERKNPCTTCEGLKRGDTLYTSSDWDVSIEFNYIWNIKFCPVCGRELNNE